jgi:ectoine hydroxylase-related dioxygenase (phytanoyl-CoA dioxygenase family)
MQSGNLLIGRSGELNQLLRAIDDDGFAVVPHVLEKREVASFLVDLPDPANQHGRAGIRHILTHPAVSALANDPRLLTLARGVLGESAFPFRATYFDKSPESNWLIAWHQDTALPVAEKHEAAGWGSWSVKDRVLYAHAPARALEQIVALRVHLDDSTTENGPLRVLPGSHRAGVLSDDEIAESTRAALSVDCIVECGGILVLRPLLVHASSKSQSSMRRRVLHIEYAATCTFSDGICLAAPPVEHRAETTSSLQNSAKPN